MDAGRGVPRGTNLRGGGRVSSPTAQQGTPTRPPPSYTGRGPDAARCANAVFWSAAILAALQMFFSPPPEIPSSARFPRGTMEERRTGTRHMTNGILSHVLRHL